MRVANMAFKVPSTSGTSSAPAISCTSGYFTTFSNISVIDFQIGLYCEGSNSTYILDTCVLNNNGTAISIYNTTVDVCDCNIVGSCSTNNTPLNTGISMTGSSALLNLNCSSCTLCGNALFMSSSAQAFVNAVTCQLNIFDIIVTTGATLTIADSDFLTTFSSSDVKINVSGTNSTAEIIGCTFNGLSATNSTQGNAIKVTGAAQAIINGGTIMDYTTGIIVGNSADTASTSVTAQTLYLKNDTTDIAQNGSASLYLDGSVSTSSKISINSATNVFPAYFDLASSNALVLPTGSAASPSLKFNGSTNTGISAATANTLSFDTAGVERMNIGPTGTIAIDAFTTAGVLHNDSSGNLSSSLIVNNDITNATISNAKLAAISSSNVVNDIVVRDGSGNFSAGTITAALSGNVTGSASLNVLKAGDTMTGTLVLPQGASATPSLQFSFSGNNNTGISGPALNTISFDANGVEQMTVTPTSVNTVPPLIVAAGSAAAPSIQFRNSTNTGFSAATANTISVDTNGVERMNINTTTINAIATLAVANAFCLQGFQTFSFSISSSVAVNATTSILLLTPSIAGLTATITFPSSPVNGQILIIVNTTTNSLTVSNSVSPNSIVNPITSINKSATLSNTLTFAAVIYAYNSANTTWYRVATG
jgi:hypothetical protein